MNSLDDITLESLTGKPRVRVKQTGELSGKTKLARDYFLYGNGDGRPIRSVVKLSELTGAGIRTIENWKPIWEREARAIAKAGTGGKGSVVEKVTQETMDLHGRTVAVLREEVKRLELLLPKLSAGTDLHRDTLKLYTATVKAWTEESGMRAYLETSQTYAKELAKQAARLQGKESSLQPVRNVSGFSFNTAPALTDSKPDTE